MKPAIVSTRGTTLTRRNKKRPSAARAAAELLEERRLLSAVVVNSIADPSATGMVTLRDAIMMANTATSPTQITFDPKVFATPQTLLLQGGQLQLTNATQPTTITGPAATLTISGENTDRIFAIDANVMVSISGLTLSQGNDAVGGAVDNAGGDLTLDDCTLTANTATVKGGGIYAYGSAQTTLNNDTISNNTSTSEDGGIANYGGTMTITNSTISGNTSAAYGGGIENDATMTMVNDTVVNNVTNANNGGGIENYGTAAITLTNVTVSGNTCNAAATYGGGGICNDGGSFEIANSIFAGNTVTGGASGPDVYGFINSLGHNLIGNTTGGTGFVPNDLRGTAANPINPDLGALADNDGPTANFLPMQGSPAIDAGSNALVPSGVTTDQRGFGRIVNGTVDIGADEVQLPPTQLAIASAPASVVTGGTLTPAITVHVEDTNGNVVTTDNSNVTLSQASGSAGTLSGTTTVAAQAGVATFSNVIISGVGISTLIASDGAITATSAAISVTPPPSQLVPAFGGVSVPLSIVAGAKIKGKATVIVRNTGATLKGNVTVKLFADTATILDGKQFLGATSVKRVTLKTGKTQAFALNLTSLPPTLGAGVYHLLAEVIDASGATNVIVATQTIQVAAAFVKPVISVGSVVPGSLAVGKTGSLLVTVTNEGNVAASGVNITLSPSSTGAAPIAGYILDTLASGVSVAPNKSKLFHVRFKIKNTFAAGTYFPYVSFQLSGVKTTMSGAIPFVIG